MLYTPIYNHIKDSTIFHCSCRVSQFSLSFRVQLSPWQLTRLIPRRPISKRGMGLATQDYVYTCLPMFTRVYLCLLLFIYVYHFYLFSPMFTTVCLCLVIYVFTCLLVSTYVYTLLPMFRPLQLNS